MLNKGFKFDYIFNLTYSEKLIVLAIIDAEMEMEAKKWQSKSV